MATQLMLDWIEDLRNPENKQCTGQLGRELADGTTAHCCLGRLYEVAGVTPTKVQDSKGGFDLVYDGNSVLPGYNLIRELFGIDPGVDFTEDNVVLYQDEYYDYVNADTANDTLGKTFPQIADLLQARYVKE